MARNSEKAVTALARWRNLQLKEAGKLYVERRPTHPTDERNLKKSEKWRNQVIQEIAKKVTQIQNAGLGEFKIRDTNDEINKLLHEKSNWEDHIRTINGPDYKKLGPKLLDKEGREAPGSRGYKYFGAAKDLPGVKELFEQEVVATRKNRAELMREIDADYYGYIDDDDYLLVEQEEKCEKEARRKNIEEFKRNKKSTQMDTDEIVPSEDEEDEQDRICTEDENEEMDEIQSFYHENSKKSKHRKVVQVPSIKEVENAILEQKKRDLLKMYVSEEMQESEQKVKELAGTII